MAGYDLTWNAAVLTESDINSYLMTQVVPRFATTGARDAAITSPTEGQMCVVTGTDREYTYSGSAWVVTGWYSTTGRVGAEVSRATQSIATSTDTAISFDTEAYDSDGFIAVTSGTLTIPSGLGGEYAVTANVTTAATANNGFMTIIAAGVSYNFNTQPVFWTVCTGTIVVPLAAAQTVTMRYYHQNGSSINAAITLKMKRVGP